jgi:isopentenyl-diphosphate delta-isomerase
MQTGEPRQPTHGFGQQTGPAQRGDEVFDVVDANDAVIGQATRREVHAKGLWHLAVHVLVFAPEAAGNVEPSAGGAGVEGAVAGEPLAGARSYGRKVFLQKRSMLKDTAPGKWDSSCSGHLDSGEDYAHAAVRELNEEIGLVVSGPEVLTEVLRLSATADTGWEFVRVYRTESAGPFTLHPAEIERGEWWAVEDVTRAVAERPGEFARAFRFIWGKVAGGVRMR